ncbi:NADH oxidoreductase [Minicystis rosea]|nr:NADH oxidoreductase [Minicystis rosea]
MALFRSKKPLPATMKALVLREWGGPLELAERPLPALRPGEVLVRVAATPVNPSDLSFLRGVYLQKPLPIVPGFEASGTVVAAGPGVGARALVGRRVACSAPADGDGTWAEYMAAPAASCIPLLPWVDTEAAASLIVNPLSAYALLDIAEQSGARAVAQTAAASSLGRMLVRLSLRRKLPMVHVVRRAAQVELLRALGAEHVLDSSEPDFDARLAEVCQKLDVRLGFDAVAGDMTGKLLAAMPRKARVLVYGALSEAPSQANPRDLIFGDKKIEGFWLSRWMKGKTFSEIGRAGLAVQRRLGDDFHTEVQARVPLEEAASGIERYRAAMTEGKVLILPERR